MRLPNLNAVKAFESAGRHGSFSAAASELHVTQGAVAQQVRKLEAELGVVLFKREPRGLRLTEAGQRYHVVVNRVFRDLDVATRAFSPRSVGLRITLPSTLASRWILMRLGLLRNAIEGQTIALDVADADTSLFDSETDMVIHHGIAPNDTRLSVTKLCDENLVAVASPSLMDVKPVNDLQELSGTMLLEDNHNRWSRIFGDNQPRLELGQSSLALNAAEAGQGVALAPFILAMDAIGINRLKVLWRDVAQSDRGYFAVTLKKHEQKLKPLVGVLRQEAQLL
ncbi:LysR family transcriptional regulator [Primorskyibacter sp. S187A]|uniref:LysR family transcriptional regulator n=1 Tax=Primorskyibacter sp. S187A TaxID=3415130 RepID=UPI003C7982A1